MPQPLLTIIHGPNIRDGSNNASFVRSELMRRRYREKRLRIHIAKSHGDFNNNNLPGCRCAQPKAHPPQSSSSTTRAIYPRHAPPPISCVSELTVCPDCHGILDKAFSFNPYQIAPGQVDPSFPDCRKTVPNFDYLLHVCQTLVFPTARTGEFANQTIQAYLNPNRSPMVAPCMFYSALLHLHIAPVLRGIPNTVNTEVCRDNKVQRLRIRGSVMNQIRHIISTIGSIDILDDKIEDVVMAIHYLVFNENLESIKRPEGGPFSPPFRTLQSLEYYGSCDPDPLHWQMVVHIIQQRGGIHSIKLYGLAWLISVSCVFTSMNGDSKPLFPLIQPDGKPAIYKAPLQTLGIRQFARHATLRNHGFRQLALLHPPVKGDIVRVLLNLSEMAQALDYLARQICGERLLALIGDTRAIIVHRLCSLPNAADQSRPSLVLHQRVCTAEEQERAFAIYIMCRKTALLYSANVIIPLPQTSLLRRKMTLEIQQCILQLSGGRENFEIEILLWCCIIAGICADGLLYGDTRSWFIKQAKRHCRDLGIGTWEQLLEFMQSFCWLDYASNEVGRAFWLEIGLADGNVV